MLTAELISYETVNELSMYAKLCRKVTSFYRQETSKQSFSSSCFIANGNRMKIYGISYIEVFNEHYTEVLNRDDWNRIGLGAWTEN